LRAGAPPGMPPHPSHDCAGTLAKEARWNYAPERGTTEPRYSTLKAEAGFSLSFGVETVMASRRKREITGAQNERDFPHIVELALPSGGCRSKTSEFDAFHRERGVPIRRGRGRREGEQFYTRFCFPNADHADAFRDRFGGELLGNASVGPLGASKRRTKRIFTPRIVADHIMMQEDLSGCTSSCLKLTIFQKFPAISARWSKKNGRSWCASCRPKDSDARIVHGEPPVPQRVSSLNGLWAGPSVFTVDTLKVICRHCEESRLLVCPAHE
jgi:hypothetical protein